MKFIGFSGPPRSGKDSIASHLHALILGGGATVKPQIVSLSMPMRRTIYALMGIEYSLTHYEANKDVPQALFGGATIRRAMIDLSEKHVKPTYGQGFWAETAFDSVWDEGQVVIASDLGFPIEAEVAIKRFGVENCVFVTVERQGTSFHNDSRNYVYGPDTYHNFPLFNNDTVEYASRRLYTRLTSLLGWKF